ncbi:hypothetical protein AcV7_009727 [Taiwanofungus camphoratus]|nr:hypothetical protein AcV7_009727 [Antrodia cinnamomea]
MVGLFYRQFVALFWKNWIVLSKHSWLNIVRCLLLPIGYSIFLAAAQTFLDKPNNYGIGTAIPVPSLVNKFDGTLTLVWADATNGTGSPSADDIMAHVTSGFSPNQLNAVKKVDSPDDVPATCPENWNGYSACFGAIVFNSLPTSSNNITAARSVNYTIRADEGLYYINVVKHTSGYEERVMPLQWAVDSAITELMTGAHPATPEEWPFSQETNAEQSTDIRLSYIRGLRNLLVLALIVCFIGIAYQIPGTFMGERASLLTSHMKAMGLLDSARIISLHASTSLAYLPAWIGVSLIWHYRIFTGTNVGLVLVIHLLLGLALASWSFFVSVPFGKSPQLAAIVSATLSIVFAILALVNKHASTTSAFFFSIFFPPGYYIFAIRAVCGFENHQIPTNMIDQDPDNQLVLLPLILAAIIDIFLWPLLAVLFENLLYDAQNPSTSSGPWWSCKPMIGGMTAAVPPGIAISIRNLGKDFQSSIFRRKQGLVTAVADLSLDIPKHGIFVLLGANGAGKSTTMSILAGLLGRTRGTVTFEGGVQQPPRGTIGLVPQKNVLFPELTCYQTLRLWKAIKTASRTSGDDEDIEQLLRDCDLGKKIHFNANALSGGQKRKLQLAIGLVGGSKILLVDECTSGVDPLSRRALWRTLNSVRHERTVVFTTHFLDEADLLADTIAVLAAPGKLVAQGTPVVLKSKLGEGYTVQVSFDPDQPPDKVSIESSELLDRILASAPLTYVSSSAPNVVSYHLKAKDPSTVQEVLGLVEAEHEASRIASYSVLSTSIEDIFLGLMDSKTGIQSENSEKDRDSSLTLPLAPTLELTNGRHKSPLSQALTIFNKRVMIARRSWLTPMLAILIAITGTCIPLFFLTGRPTQSCGMTSGHTPPTVPLYLPYSPIILADASNSARGKQVLTSPPGVLSMLGPAFDKVPVQNITDNATFVNLIAQDYRNLSVGGVSVDLQTGSVLLAWEATPPGLTGLVMLNLASNIVYNNALNASGTSEYIPGTIVANYQDFPGFDSGTLVALKWLGFFGTAMAAFPAFFSLYVSTERRSLVQAMQLSNGLSDPAGLWLGHLMFDSIFAVVAASVMMIIFATVSHQFHGIGYFWVVMTLYGVVGALFSYCVSLVVASPLAAFALSAGYQAVMFLLYLAAYLLTITYAEVPLINRDISIIHYTISILAPVTSAVRASFVSINLFSLLCNGNSEATTSELSHISKYGGPILYLFIQGFLLFGILVWVDSGSILPCRSPRKKQLASPSEVSLALGGRQDVDREAAAVANSAAALRVLNVMKTFGSSANRVVDDVSFGVSQNSIFALLGPNGAGKTTTFNIIRGDVLPDQGDVMINGISVVHHPRTARLSLGVCPQFTAIDSQLTVKEHLMVYGRLKGLHCGEELERNVHALMQATSLHMYADRLASRLSGGNQRKLALAIALLGNPSVVLIDEFSTGIDAKIKRDMWETLRTVAVGKAIVITTHSMEEASALASKVGILATKMLAVGTTESLAERYATYEVHFSCRTREELIRAHELMVQIPGSRKADDVATRYEVPLGNGMSLAQLFAVLSSQDDPPEYTVERPSLESVFLKVIRENEVLEEDRKRKNQRRSIMGLEHFHHH